MPMIDVKPNRIFATREGSGPKIDLSQWNLNTVDAFAAAFKEMAAAAVAEALALAADSSIEAALAWGFGPEDWYCDPKVPTPTDATTIYIFMPLGTFLDDDDKPAWRFSIRDLVEEMLRGHRSQRTGRVAPEPQFIRIRDELRALAEHIDAAIDPNEKTAAEELAAHEAGHPDA